MMSLWDRGGNGPWTSSIQRWEMSHDRAEPGLEPLRFVRPQTVQFTFSLWQQLTICTVTSQTNINMKRSSSFLPILVQQSTLTSLPADNRAASSWRACSWVRTTGRAQAETSTVCSLSDCLDQESPPSLPLRLPEGFQPRFLLVLVNKQRSCGTMAFLPDIVSML